MVELHASARRHGKRAAAMRTIMFAVMAGKTVAVATRRDLVILTPNLPALPAAETRVDEATDG